MDKMGNNSPAEYQLCFTHAIHLAAVGVNYKNQDDNKNQNVNVEDDCENFTVKILISSVIAMRMKMELLSKLLIFILSFIKFWLRFNQNVFVTNFGFKSSLKFNVGHDSNIH